MHYDCSSCVLDLRMIQVLEEISLLVTEVFLLLDMAGPDDLREAPQLID